MLETLKGRTALITGASKRIGRETALALAEQGVNIALHFNRSEGDAQQLAAELERKGVKAWTVITGQVIYVDGGRHLGERGTRAR